MRSLPKWVLFVQIFLRVDAFFVVQCDAGYHVSDTMCSGARETNRQKMNGPGSVSYTHLDVYKRQAYECIRTFQLLYL